MTTSSPTSLQLRLAFSGGITSKPLFLPRFVVLLRPRPLISRRSRRCLRMDNAAAGEGNESPVGFGWSDGADNGAGTMSGWSDSSGGHGEEIVPPERFKSLGAGGMIGAAVAGVVLVVGVACAALSLGKGGSSRRTQEMETLTKQEEIMLTSDEQTVDTDEHLNKGSHVVEDDVYVADKKPDDDLTLFSVDKVDAENKAEKNIDIPPVTMPDGLHTSASYVSHEIRSSSNEDLLDESTFDGLTSSPETDFGPNMDPERQMQDSSHTTHVPDSYVSLDEVAVQSSPGSIEGVSLIETPSNERFKDYSSGSMALEVSASSQLDTTSEPKVNEVSRELKELDATATGTKHELDQSSWISVEERALSLEQYIPFESTSPPAFEKELDESEHDQVTGNQTFVETPSPLNAFSYAGIPAPLMISKALLVNPGKILVPPTVDQIQGQALAALQALKVIEADVKAGDICTRREYARWLVSASSALSSSSISKVYPAMYIENVSELAFDDITPDDPDFIYIQGLAEAGLISSKLSRQDLAGSGDDAGAPYYFYPACPLSRQDLVSWKMALEKKPLPEANRETLRQFSGFIDAEKIDPDACPSIVADLSAGEQGIVALAFGYTKLFQPDKPVTNAQAAIAIASNEASEIVNEELARIEAEAMAENAVAAHSALVGQVEKDLKASFEKILSVEREKIDVVEKMADEAKRELERLRTERKEDSITLMKARAAVESEMEVLSKLRREVEEQLESLMTNKVEISYEKERIAKLKNEAEKENQEITRLQYELEVERKALSLARAWAEDEAKRAREHAKALKEARDCWESQGIKVVVDNDLQEETSKAGITWLNAGQQLSVDETIDRAETVTDKLKHMASLVTGKSRDLINNIIQIVTYFVLNLRRWSLDAKKEAEEKGRAVLAEFYRSQEELQHSFINATLSIKDGAKRLAGDCKEGVDKLTQRFKT
ncbi:hypothetical protein MLD38_002879 [Melastoma candidum]|uniref:Uncharacterized protein n=1 Tax=Melastoma candidum TaxID=119954 RepID=A0ACB9S2C4_9MYRT|nr:hypothetical protein MLD38_002879 [Melastoma candidum]